MYMLEFEGTQGTLTGETPGTLKFYLHKMTRIHELSNYSKITQFGHREDLQHIKEVESMVVIKDI